VPSDVPPEAVPPGGTARTPRQVPRQPVRNKLPDERDSITHKFSIAGHEGYITVGKYPNGLPGEIFIVMAKEGSTVSGLMDSFATAISLALQYGVPLKVLVDKFSHTRFEPSGWTGHEGIGYAKSIMDYIFRWLALKFLPGYESSEPTSLAENGGSEADLADANPSPDNPSHDRKGVVASLGAQGAGGMSAPLAPVYIDAPTCSDCGSIMTRNGSCYKCENCGATSGCS
jgi:ribonucleoside-diphosphate reductase alpha chain